MLTDLVDVVDMFWHKFTDNCTEHSYLDVILATANSDTCTCTSMWIIVVKRELSFTGGQHKRKRITTKHMTLPLSV